MKKSLVALLIVLVVCVLLNKRRENFNPFRWLRPKNQVLPQLPPGVNNPPRLYGPPPEILPPPNPSWMNNKLVEVPTAPRIDQYYKNLENDAARMKSQIETLETQIKTLESEIKTYEKTRPRYPRYGDDDAVFRQAFANKNEELNDLKNENERLKIEVKQLKEFEVGLQDSLRLIGIKNEQIRKLKLSFQDNQKLIFETQEKLSNANLEIKGKNIQIKFLESEIQRLGKGCESFIGYNPLEYSQARSALHMYASF